MKEVESGGDLRLLEQRSIDGVRLKRVDPPVSIPVAPDPGARLLKLTIKKGGFPRPSQDSTHYPVSGYENCYALNIPAL